MMASDPSQEVNKHYEETLKKWKDRTSRGITFVVAGRSGAGKSTLVKNMLNLSGKEAPREGHGPKPTTNEVKQHQAKIHGVTVGIVDMPGLAAASEKSERKILQELEISTDKKADMLLYCVSLLPNSKIDNVDKRIVVMLTKAFGKGLWEKAILVLTFANIAKSLPRKSVSELITEYALAFQEVMHSAKLSSFRVEPSLKPDKDHVRDAMTIAALPAGQDCDEVIIEGARWDDNIYIEALKKCEYEAIPALLCLKGISLDRVQIALASFGGIGTSAIVGGGAGAGIGALIGGLVGLGVGAIPGAIIGGGVGAGASTITTTTILGVMAGNVVARRMQENELKKND